MRFLGDKKIAITILACVVVILLLVWTTFFLQSKKIRDSSEEYQKEKLSHFVLQEKEDKLLQFKKELADIEKRERDLKAVFVKKDEIVPLIKYLEQIAESSSCLLSIEPVDLAKIKFEKTQKTQKKESDLDEEEKKGKTSKQTEEKKQEEKEKDELADIRNYPAFNVSVIGSFPSVVNFLSKLENLPFFIRSLIIDVSEDKKTSSKTATEAGILAVGSKDSSVSETSENKNVKMVLTVVVYAQ